MNTEEIELVPLEQIYIANPRSRSKPRWQAIVANIREVGLKKPISVTRRGQPDPDGKCFDLICGQGRIEAFIALGETHIPAIVAEAAPEDRHLMSLVENIARRPPSSKDILREIKRLREMGYRVSDIARKLGKSSPYITCIVHLVDQNEVALIEAVETGKLPLSVATQIASGKDSEVSQALSEAYDSGDLRGNKLSYVRRLVAKRVEQRQRNGQARDAHGKVTGNMLVQVYKQRVAEQKALIAKAQTTKERLLLLTSAFRQLIADDNFVTLLRAERSADVPKQLMVRLK
jgi:ParB family chromosome partitioning protein